MHPNSLKNLTKGHRFGSGQPTNRGGAPAGKRLSTLLREIGEAEIDFTDLDGLPTRMPAKKALAVALMGKALSGDVQAIKLIGSYYLANETEQPMQHEIDPTMIKMMREMGLNVEGIAQRDDVIVCG